MLRGLQQAHHARLDQIGDLHLRRQAPGQMVGDALDQIGMLAHQRIQIRHRLRLGIGAHAVIHLRTFSCGAARVSSRSKKNSS